MPLQRICLSHGQGFFFFPHLFLNGQGVPGLNFYFHDLYNSIISSKLLEKPNYLSNLFSKMCYYINILKFNRK